MKANELMIGDWYSLVNPDKHKCIPQKLTIDGLYLLCTDTRYNCEPIPLTAEILEKNGFVEEGNLEEGMWFRHPQWNLTLSFYEVWDVVDIVLGNEIGFCEISFVHQLQHALRLCGLNELADNFKID